MRNSTRRLRLTSFSAFAALVASTFASTALVAPAEAQSRTFKLDRLETPGGPEDGLVLFRPKTENRARVFGQLSIGYARRPLRTSSVVNDASVLARSSGGIVDNQLSVNANVGIEFLDRVVLNISFPFSPVVDGQSPEYGGNSIFTNPNRASFTYGASVSDLRLDARVVAFRSQDRKLSLGGQLSLFAPTGTNTAFGGDGKTGGMFLVTGEAQTGNFIFVANTGFQFRPYNSVNSPGTQYGLGVANEWRWAVGGFLPLKEGKYRLGVSLFGQTGIEDSTITGDTVFTLRNTPIEWNVEARARFGKADRMWASFGAGSFVLKGYGAPDLRVIGTFGIEAPLSDEEAKSNKRQDQREKWRKESTALDTDHDGVPDDYDACPNDAEDHLGAQPDDGCPNPPDRDGDGVLDKDDRCPDERGPASNQGCPEPTDIDKDGIPNTEDACPKEPGPKSSDPGKNGCPQFFARDGSELRIFQQVHFASGSATILPDSFPLLQEIANLLAASPNIKLMSIDGHTDNRGPAPLNRTLSQSRASAVMAWLTQHNVSQARLAAKGYGPDKPIETNDTDPGRAKNRRVEFKILKED